MRRRRCRDFPETQRSWRTLPLQRKPMDGAILTTSRTAPYRLCRVSDSATRRVRNNSALRQAIVLGPAHFDRTSVVAIFAPMTFTRVKAFSRAATVADEDVRLL